uniref:Uncharacterized protein n=1 Tax=viral metagenome TaxID=1070528 RepID=A0A6H1ZJK9_9ZZZZ
MMGSSIIVCCQDMLCDLTRVNDAFEYGFWWEDNDGEQLRLYECLSDKEGDAQEITSCPNCGERPLSRFEEEEQGPPPNKWRWGRVER